MVPIKIPTLIGGVSRSAQAQRPSHMLQEADNVSLSVARGVEKRAGTEFIAAPGTTDGSLDVVDPTNDKHIGWIDRDTGEQFVYFVDPAQALTDAEVIQVFEIDGTEVTVNYNATNPRQYLLSGTIDPRRRLRSMSIADSTLFLNKEVATALSGAAITYQNEAGAVNWRNKSSANNFSTWSDFPHPPTGTVSPVGDTSDDFIYYAREDDVGQPQGFYAAISTTQPPWYQRIRTEGANSLVDASTMPIQMTFNGTSFDVARVTWTDRLSGDSAINPGPTFIGNTLTDFALHQGRLFFAGGERIYSSQAADLFNLWLNSSTLQVDSDPVDDRIGNNRVSNIEFLTSFRDALVMMTSGAKQYELRADGPLTPNTKRLEPTTTYQSVQYVQPATLGDQLYFAGERNFANIIYEYYLSPDSVSNVAVDITSVVEGYIPAEMSQMEASEAHDTLFILTDAEPNNIYVYKATYNGDQKVISSWYRWVTDEGNEILSLKTFGDFLYMVIRRDDLLWLERVAIEAPENDVIGVLDMGFAVRLDRKQLLLGAYDEIEDVTVWTLPFEDDTITEIVLGPEWDVDVGDESRRLKGTRLTPEVELVAGQTLLTVSGQYEVNLAGTDAEAYVGRPYTMDIELCQQYVRDQNGQPQNGNVQLLTAVIRHNQTGYYTVEITPGGRETFVKEFIFPRVASSELDGEFVEETGEFRFRVLAAAHNVSIHIKNDSPLPSNIVDLEFIANFVPLKGNPNK